jgi:hypothetical protein
MSPHHASMLVGQAPVANQLAFARRSEYMDTAIDAQDLAGRGQRLPGAFALKAPIPAAVLLDEPGPTALIGNLPPLAQLHRANPRHDDTTADEPQRSIAGRERQLLPALVPGL